MPTRTEDYPFNRELSLWEQLQSHQSFRVTVLSLTWQDDQPIECRLALQISPDVYSQIEPNANEIAIVGHIPFHNLDTGVRGDRP
jgi:hypothetical protein